MKRLLDGIDSPEDIKKLSLDELQQLAREIRIFLVKSVAKTGGHLASNLGVVELTLALHYSFNAPKDKIIWDVGHQSYVHKILTGRKDGFENLRQFGGLSGFPKPNESKYDAFATGHSSTSISAALGMACARDLEGGDEQVISVIGDGSMTGGLAFEALNNAGLRNTNLIIILNDNQMSISPNVGAMSGHLNRLRLAPEYRGMKEEVHRTLDRIPYLGKPIDKAIEKLKGTLKYMLLPGVVFEEMGLRYFGPIDGHDIKNLTEVFKQAKNTKGPMVIHVYTKKGKGYKYAEKHPCAFHGIGAFDYKTGNIEKSKGETYSSAFGKTLLALGEENEKIIAISAAMTVSTGLLPFKQRFPERFFDVGIAEQHAVTFSAGLSAKGFIPVFAVYSSFLQRAYDQVVHDVCTQNLHVVFAIDRAGIVGCDGETHQGVFDIAFLSHIPNMTLMSPKNIRELNEMLRFAVRYNGPVAVRYPKCPAPAVFPDHMEPISLGKWEVLKEGEDFALIFEGSMSETANTVYEKLLERGKNPFLINARFMKPLDTEGLEALKNRSIRVFTIEDGVRAGGMGASIREALGDLGAPELFIHNFGFPDTFIEQGAIPELFKKYGLDADAVAGRIISILDKTDDK